MATVLVTGAAGFIGSHTVEALLAAGHRVVGVDNFRTGRESNLAAARRHERFTFHQLDLLEPTAFLTLTREVLPEAVIHLAALVSVPESIRDPGLNFRLNVEATQVVIEATAAAAAARVVFASSAAVYGDAAALPLREEGIPRPISPYGAAKLASENLLLGCGASLGFTVRCQRYFNVFGPRQAPESPYSGVLSAFLERCRRGQAVTIFGDGEQTRDFVYVADVARANVMAATLPALPSGVANICTGRAVSLNAVCALFAERFRVPPAIRSAVRRGDIRHSCGDPGAAAAVLGFRAETTLAGGIDALLAAAGPSAHGSMANRQS
jgi:UDP-glucose 4-epimerase